MHDGGGDRHQTVSALRTVLRYLAAKGYRFDRLPGCR
jgi:peptidoglycan/xylan/chitin deacetylase (PgdA/CDA1 family)